MASNPEIEIHEIVYLNNCTGNCWRFNDPTILVRLGIRIKSLETMCVFSIYSPRTLQSKHTRHVHT